MLAGPLGSGKTTRLLHRVRQRFEAGDYGFRLLVPTATAAGHLRRQLAREGWVFPGRVVDTLSGFLAPLAPPPVSAVRLDQLLREVLAQQLATPDSGFAALSAYRGFRDRVSGVLDELATAGCSPALLATAVGQEDSASPILSALAETYAQLYARLTTEGLELSGPRLTGVARQLARTGVPGCDEIILDGFFAFSRPEREILLALAQHVALTVSLPTGWPEAELAREFLRAHGAVIEQTVEAAPSAAIVRCPAPSIEAEASDIARRILERHASGTPFRHIGVILRSEQPYRTLLASTFARFGIPARFYFSDPLEHQPPVRMLSAVITSLLSGWDRAQLADVLLATASGLGATTMGDRLEHELLAKMPGSGLDEMGPLEAQLAALEGWRTASRTPDQWATALIQLRSLCYPAATVAPRTHQEADQWRRRANALDAWERALAAAAQCGTASPECSTLPVTLESFWREAQEALRLTAFRVYDERREAVHVLDVFEARQWRLPHVFVCGLLEGQFPHYPSPDPLLPDAFRDTLRRHGIALRTTRDRLTDERLLFDVALSRAETQVCLSWPRLNAQGDETLPSFHLDETGGTESPAVACRPQPGAARWPSTLTRIERPVDPPTKRWSPSEIETFLKCPFQYFAGRTLRLAEPPAAPEERFGVLEHGSLAHSVLRQLHEGDLLPHWPQQLDALFDRLFREECRKTHVVVTHQVEWDRLELLRNLRAFLKASPAARGWRSQVEWAFEFPLRDGLWIRGRIDRFDESPTGDVRAIDYKYSQADRIKKRFDAPDAVQGGLYLMALRQAGKKPVGFAYVPLKGDPREVEAPDPAELMAQAQERTLAVVEQVRQGVIEPKPSDLSNCNWCDYRDACRARERVAAQAAAGGSSGEDAE